MSKTSKLTFDEKKFWKSCFINAIRCEGLGDSYKSDFNEGHFARTIARFCDYSVQEGRKRNVLIEDTKDIKFYTEKIKDSRNKYLKKLNKEDKEYANYLKNLKKMGKKIRKNKNG